MLGVPVQATWLLQQQQHAGIPRLQSSTRHPGKNMTRQSPTPHFSPTPPQPQPQPQMDTPAPAPPHRRLFNNSLSGTLPPEWADPQAFRRLQILALQENNLIGGLEGARIGGWWTVGGLAGGQADV